jgi:aldose sugar dehydrogenase
MRCSRAIPHLLCALACTPLLTLGAARAQSPIVDDPSLRISTYLDGLSQPTGMRFFGSNEGFVIEKASGKVQFFNAPGAIASTALTLNVQSDGERGLLGIALDPGFKANNPYVYLYYSATSASGDWTGNQLAKYQWNSQTQKLTATATTRTISSPASPSEQSFPFHNGGPLVFGSDGNLYGITGDLNRNGVQQNIASGANSNVGGVYRFNTNLTPAAGNPFTGSFAQWYSYGVRNSFGLAVDPATGNLWDTENGISKYDEINLLEKGMNGGWKKIQGPASGPGSDPQNPPLSALDMLPGAFYRDPKFSFLNVIAPTSIQFLYGSAWGPSYDDAVVVGDNNTHRLYLLRLNATRTGFVLTGDLADLVARTSAETDSLVFGRDFGTVTDLELGPDGALYVTSLTDGKVYRIAPVPEPETWAMLAAGLVLVSALGLRRRNQRLSLA